MTSKIIFDIPVYGRTIDAFNKCWNGKKLVLKKQAQNSLFEKSSYYNKIYNEPSPQKRSTILKDFLKNIDTSKLDTEYTKLLSIIYGNRVIWKYNQIIAHIEVTVDSSGDINFNIFSPSLNQRPRYDSTQKIFTSLTYTPGTHFNASIMSEIQIKETLHEWLHQRFYKIFSLKKIFIDTSTFDNTIDYIDIKKIISDLSISS